MQSILENWNVTKSSCDVASVNRNTFHVVYIGLSNIIRKRSLRRKPNLLVSKSHFHKNTDNLRIVQHTDFGDCWTLSRSLVYQLQWMENLILARPGVSNWNECKVSYREFINWDITMNGYLQFVILDGYYNSNYNQDLAFCATFSPYDY